jgi:capsular polysaccharide biosynthesis protein
MEKYQENYEKEIDLKDLFVKLSHGWRMILIFSIICSILLGGYKYLSGMHSVNDSTIIKNQDESYHTALTIYETSKEALENDVDKITTSIERQKLYNENSELMNMDPFDEKLAAKSFYVSTDYKIMPEMTYQNVDITKSVIQAYLSAIHYGDMYKYIKNELDYDIELKFLKELITVEADYDTNMINLKVIHSDTNKCEEIFAIVLEYVDQVKANITNSVGAHTLTGIDESIQSVVDLNLDATQKNNLLLITNYENSLTEKQNALKALVAPAKTVTTKSMVIKSAIKYSILGFVLGVFLVAGILLFSYITSDRLQNSKELRPRYNIRILGLIEKNNKKRLFGFIDRWINRLEGKSDHKLSEDEAIQRVAANLKAICELNNITGGDIIITGTINPNRISEICEKVRQKLQGTSHQLLSGANISYSASTIDQMKNSNAVVIVEEIGISTYTEITKQLECINDLGKNVIGAILV